MGNKALGQMEQLTFLIVFIFTQPQWGFCLIHGAHHDFLRKETILIENKNTKAATRKFQRCNMYEVTDV